MRAYVHEVQDFGYWHSLAIPKCQCLDSYWRRWLSPLSFPDCVACDFHCRKEVFFFFCDRWLWQTPYYMTEEDRALGELTELWHRTIAKMAA